MDMETRPELSTKYRKPLSIRRCFSPIPATTPWP